MLQRIIHYIHKEEIGGKEGSDSLVSSSVKGEGLEGIDNRKVTAEYSTVQYTHYVSVVEFTQYRIM